MSGALLPGLAAELAALDGVRQRHAAPPDPARELIVDNFAGGGGASTGIAMALGPQHTFQVLTKRPERRRCPSTGRLMPKTDAGRLLDGALHDGWPT